MRDNENHSEATILSVSSVQVHDLTVNATIDEKSSESISNTKETLGDWLSRRRIAISLVAFSLLIVFNLLIKGTRPYHPFVGLNSLSALGTGLVLSGLAIRSWAAGTLHKSQEVTKVGPYALVRNPLYVGSFLMMYGFCFLMQDWPALAFIAGPMSILYWYQVRVEERNLSEWFGDDWSNYVQSTGRFLPRSLQWSVFSNWSLGQWKQNREYQAVFATLVALVALGLLAT